MGVLRILPPQAKPFLIIYSVTLGMLAILDAIAVALLAVVIGPILSNSPVDLPIIGQVDDQGLILLLGLVCVLIMSKSVIAVVLLWGATRRFARYELDLGSRLFETYVAASWTERLKRNSADLVRLTDNSVAVVIAGLLLPGATLLGEAMSFVAVLGVLAIAQPTVALISLLYLGFIGAMLYFWVTRRSREAGAVTLRYSLRTSRLITEMIGALKEITLRDRLGAIGDVVRANRWHSARARGNAVFLKEVPRYVLEAGIIGGFLLVGVTGFLTGGTTGAITAVALFGLAGFRIAPSIVRFQSVVNQVQMAAPHAERVLDEIARSERTAGRGIDERDTATPPDPPREMVFERVLVPLLPRGGRRRARGRPHPAVRVGRRPRRCLRRRQVDDGRPHARAPVAERGHRDGRRHPPRSGDPLVAQPRGLRSPRGLALRLDGRPERRAHLERRL